MKKLLALIALFAFASPAAADWTGKDASGATITFKNTNTCSSVVCIPIAQPVDSTGAAFGVSANPFFITAASLPLPSLAATSTKQSDGTQKSQQVDGSGNVAPAGDTAARAGFQKLTDGTNTMAVKAASTAAGATDPSGVTNESPNSQLSVAAGTSADTACPSSGTATLVGCARATAIAAQNGTAANGSAPSASSVGVGGVGSGATGGLQRAQIICDQHAFFDSTTQLTTLVAGVSGRKTYICGFILATGGTATNIGLTSGTGTNCATTSVAITPVYQLVANDRVGANSPTWNGLISLAAADNLCQSASAANSHQVELWYSVQ